MLWVCWIIQAIYSPSLWFPSAKHHSTRSTGWYHWRCTNFSAYRLLWTSVCLSGFSSRSWHLCDGTSTTNLWCFRMMDWLLASKFFQIPAFPLRSQRITTWSWGFLSFGCESLVSPMIDSANSHARSKLIERCYWTWSKTWLLILPYRK